TIHLSHGKDNTFDLRGATARAVVKARPNRTKLPGRPATAGPGEFSGKVQGGGSPIAGSTVTLYAAGEGKPMQLAQGKTNDDGTCELEVAADKPKGSAGKVLYLVARGGTPRAAGARGPNDAIALLAVLGTARPKAVTVNELTTVASTFTSARFINGEAISGK